MTLNDLGRDVGNEDLQLNLLDQFVSIRVAIVGGGNLKDIRTCQIGGYTGT